MFYLYLYIVANVHINAERSSPERFYTTYFDVGVLVSYSRVLSWYLKSLCFEKCSQEEHIMTYKDTLGFTFTCGHCNIDDFKSHLQNSDSLFLVTYPFHFNIFYIYDSIIKDC